MPNGQPFNLLSAAGMSASVSQAFKAFYAKASSEAEPHLAGLGTFNVSGAYGVSADIVQEKWVDWNGQGQSGSIGENVYIYQRYVKDPDTGQWREIDPSHQEESQWPFFDWVKEEYRLTFMCDRILLCQNCTAEVEEVQVGGQTVKKSRIVFGETPLWFAPRTSSGGRVGVAEASVRPWTIPAGDIEGWPSMGSQPDYPTGRQVDFVPMSTCPHETRTTRQALANAYLTHWEDRPEAWNIPDGVPVARVVFNPPRNADGKIVPETVQQARSYIENHSPDEILYWCKVPAGSVDMDGNPVLEEKQVWLSAWHDRSETGTSLPPGESIVAEGVPDGVAFDLFVLFKTWAYRHRVNNVNLAALGTVAEQGWGPGHDSQDINSWSFADPKYPYRFFEASPFARVVKELPPAERGGGA